MPTILVLTGGQPPFNTFGGAQSLCIGIFYFFSQKSGFAQRQDANKNIHSNSATLLFQSCYFILIVRKPCHRGTHEQQKQWFSAQIETKIIHFKVKNHFSCRSLDNYPYLCTVISTAIVVLTKHIWLMPSESPPRKANEPTTTTKGSVQQAQTFLIVVEFVVNLDGVGMTCAFFMELMQVYVEHSINF